MGQQNLRVKLGEFIQAVFRIIRSEDLLEAAFDLFSLILYWLGA
jgi:hypothetical protein